MACVTLVRFDLKLEMGRQNAFFYFYKTMALLIAKYNYLSIFIFSNKLDGYSHNSNH